MRYKIIENPNYTMRSKIGIEIFAENIPLMFFLSGLNIFQFPQYISELVKDINFGVENASFVFYYQMDWEDKSNFYDVFLREIEEDELVIRFYDGRANYSVMKTKDFEQIFYDYSKKILEVYQSDISLPVTWVNDMEEALEKLKVKIETKDFI